MCANFGVHKSHECVTIDDVSVTSVLSSSTELLESNSSELGEFCSRLEAHREEVFEVMTRSCFPCTRLNI